MEPNFPDNTFKGWHSRGFLPHFDSENVIQFITYRLADSVPVALLQTLKYELSADTITDIELRRKIESHLDAGYGSCLQKQPQIANIVYETWMHNNDKSYRIHEWVVMPNHVHILVEFHSRSMSETIREWKTVSAFKINKLLGQKGKVWQEDYWDRFIRNIEHYEHSAAYIKNNPVKAGLVKHWEDWPWVSR